jgi:DNA-binding XRE family transcriptional regulator
MQCKMETPTMFAEPEPLLTLDNLRHEIATKSFSVPKLAAMLPIHIDRISDLVSADARRQAEPWLHEAWMLARTLGVSDICTLIGQPLDAIVTYEATVSDLDVWRAGVHLPLTTAVRLTRRFGLADPYDLYEIIRLRSSSPILLETWSAIETGERTSALRTCPWCSADVVGGAAHLPTCIPAHLWGPRSTPIADKDEPKPRVPGKRQIGSSAPAPGLKALRERHCKTQEQMAHSLRISVGHYSKLEACKTPLSRELAIKIGHTFGINPIDLTSPPGAAEDAKLSGDLTYFEAEPLGEQQA